MISRNRKREQLRQKQQQKQRRILEKKLRYKGKQPEYMQKVQQPAEVTKVKYTNNTFIHPLKLVQLFNIRQDPLEKYDISRRQPAIVRKMLTRLQEFYLTSVPTCYPVNEKVFPIKKAWGPWKDGSTQEEFCPQLV